MKLTQRKRLAALFVSFTIIIIGAASLLESMTIDYYSVVNTVLKIIPAAFAMGTLGWVMGMILDKPRKKGVSTYNKMMMKELLNRDNIITPPTITDNIEEDIGK